GPARTVIPHRRAAEPGDCDPVEAGADTNTDPKRHHSRGDLGRASGREAAEDARHKTSATMDQKEAGHVSKRGDGETLPTGDDAVFATLQRAPCDAPDSQRTESASLRSTHLVPDERGDTPH